MSELRGRCKHCDGYYCDNVGGCPVHEVVEAQATAPMGLRELNDLQSAKYNLMKSTYEEWYQQAAATFYYTYPTIIEGV